MSGYAQIHRSLIGHPAFRNDAEAMAFAYLILKASWQPARVRYKGKALELARGQLALSVRDFAEAMDRDKGWVERLLRRLKSETMVETRAETGVLVITICNYDDFQASADESKTVRKTRGETRARQTQDTEQRIEKGKKEESDVANATSHRASRLSDDWSPQTPYPKSIQELVVQWPPGRLDRELEGFRDYWISRTRDAAKLNWDRTWHNRIRDQHDRITRENRNGKGQHANGTRSGDGFFDAAFDLATGGPDWHHH